MGKRFAGWSNAGRPERITILISSAGSRAAEAILASLAGVRAQIRWVGTNSVADFASLGELDVAYLVPPTQDAPAFMHRMRKIVEAERPDVILNGRDEEVAMLAVLARETGCLFLGPPPQLAPVFSDKYQTYQFALNHGLPFAQTAASAEELDRLCQEQSFPLIAKPRCDGHASKDVFLLFNRLQADRALANGAFVFQPYIGPKDFLGEMSEWGKSWGIPWVSNPVNVYYMLDFVVGSNAKAVSWCVTRAERSGSNIQRLEVFEDEVFEALVHRHVAALGQCGHIGPVNVQGYLDRDGNFYAFEWNARFVGSVDGYALLGKNLVLDALVDRFPFLGVSPLAGDARRVLFRPLMYKAVPLVLIRTLELHGRVVAECPAPLESIECQGSDSA